MQFTLKQLRYFDAALRTGSIARAAVEMNISQSSITAAIDNIEQAAGAELFRRMPAKGIAPTDIGIGVGERIREFLEQTRIFESDLLTIAGNPAGTLRLGCYAPTAPYVLPPILKQISSDFPEISIELKEGDMRTISDLLSSGRIDLALTYRREIKKSLPFVSLFLATPIAFVPATWPLANQDEVSLAELVEQPMILLDMPGTRPYFCGIFEAQGLRPKIVHTTKSSSVLRCLVAANFGYALMNICGPNDLTGQNGYVVRHIRGDHDTPQFGIAFNRASRRSALVKAMLVTCRDISSRGGFKHILDPVCNSAN